MKEKRKQKIFSSCIAFLCLATLLTALIQPVEAKKFSKTEAKKKVSVTYKKLSDGVLAIYKNKNKTNLKLTATMRFQDGDKKDLSKEEQTNLCLTGNSTATFFFPAPRDAYGKVINYSSYKGSFSIDKSKKTSRIKNIKVSSTLETIEGKFVAVNTGTKKLTNIHATLVFYADDGTVWFCSPKYLNCYNPNDIDQFSINYVDKPYRPSKVKVYIDWAY